MLSRSRLFATHALAAVFIALLSASTQAQKPAITKSIDEPGRNPYTSAISKGCDTSCSGQFKTVPAGYRLVVTYIQVNYSVTESGPSYVTLAGGQAILYLPQVAPVSNSGTARVYILSTPTTYYVEPGASPQVTVSNATGLNSVLIGYLVAID